MTKRKMRAQRGVIGSPAVAPYGSWKSPITSNLITRQSIKLSEVRLDGDDIYWLEDQPQENGRCVIVLVSRAQFSKELTFGVSGRLHHQPRR